MKQIFFLLAFFMLTSCAVAQTINKGGLIGFHVITVSLKPGATLEQFKSYWVNNVIPAYESAFPGARGYMATGVRGEHANDVAVIWLFDSANTRDRYFGTGQTEAPTEAGKAALAKVASVNKALEAIGTYTSKFTDWVVQ